MSQVLRDILISSARMFKTMKFVIYRV